MWRDTAIYGAAVAGERALGLLLLPVLTRSTTPEDYAVWTQTAAVSGLLMPLVLLGLPTAIARHLAHGVEPSSRQRLMRQALAGVLAGLVVLASVALLLPGPIARALYGSASAASYVPIVLLVLACDALVDLLTAFWRAASRLPAIAAVLLARAALRCGFMVTALALLGWDFASAFASLAMLQLVLAALLFALQREPAVGGTAEAPPWSRLVRFGAPLALSSLLATAHAQADRLVLAQQLGLAPLASYAAAASLVSIGAMAYTVPGYTLLPELARRWHAGDTAPAAALAVQALRMFGFAALPVVVVLAGAGDELLPLVTTAHYRVEPLVWALLGVALLAFGTYQIALYVLLLQERGLAASALLAAALVLNLALNLVLVAPLGLVGAAAAAAASNLLLAALALRGVRALLPGAALRRQAGAAALRGAGAMAALLAVRANWGDAPGPAAVALATAAALAAYAAADVLVPASVLRGLHARTARRAAP